MGAIADAVWAYAQPLLDDTDGSVEDMNWALSLSQLCWNLACSRKRNESNRSRKCGRCCWRLGRTSKSFGRPCSAP